MNQFLIDSGAFLSLLDTRDKFHADARQFAQANQGATFFIPEFIFAENDDIGESSLSDCPKISSTQTCEVSETSQV